LHRSFIRGKPKTFFIIDEIFGFCKSISVFFSKKALLFTASRKNKRDFFEKQQDSYSIRKAFSLHSFGYILQ